jgi:hypothetical protein
VKLGFAGQDGAFVLPLSGNGAGMLTTRMLSDGADNSLIIQGVNTDQSLPAHPVWGPTAPLPDGVRQIGH